MERCFSRGLYMRCMSILQAFTWYELCDLVYGIDAAICENYLT